MLTPREVADQLDAVMPTGLIGTVSGTEGMTVSAASFPAPVGALVEITCHSGRAIEAEVIGFREQRTLLYPLDEPAGIRRGDRVRLVRTTRWLRVGDELLGRVIDARGRVVDGLPQPSLDRRARFQREPPHPCDRPPIDRALGTGIRAIDGLLTCGHGQRIGIFAGSGVGKSVLLGMMARHTSADVIVIGLIGERGREVNEFIQRDLGETGLAKSVVVVATSDEPALARVQATAAATAVAESFRDRGRDVLLLMDSLTRFALAQREIGLAAGEPPTTRGFPPSVFARMPRLVERAGQSPRGSITAFYSVLVEGDDPNEPISDAVRGLLDGHIWLSRKLASKGHYPAIDVIESLSRLTPLVTDRPHQDAAQLVRELLSAYRENEDLISIGAYRQGSNAAVDLAIVLRDRIDQYLRQRIEEPCRLDEAKTQLMQLTVLAMQQQQRAKQAGAGPQATPAGPQATPRKQPTQ